MKVKTGHIHPKVAVSDANFLWLLSPHKKSKKPVDPFQRYWQSKNTVIWLAERILGYNWKTRFFPHVGVCWCFHRIIKNNVLHLFYGKKNTSIKSFTKKKKKNFLLYLLGFSPNENFSKQISSVSVLPLRPSKISEKSYEVFQRKTGNCSTDILTWWHKTNWSTDWGSFIGTSANDERGTIIITTTIIIKQSTADFQHACDKRHA